MKIPRFPNVNFISLDIRYTQYDLSIRAKKKSLLSNNNSNNKLDLHNHSRIIGKLSQNYYLCRLKLRMSTTVTDVNVVTYITDSSNIILPDDAWRLQ